MGRTNIVLDDELIEKAMEVTGARSKREAVDVALRRLVRDADVLAGLSSMRGRFKCVCDTDSLRRERS